MMPDYGEAVFPLRNLPHLWGRGTAIAVEGALPKVTQTVLHQHPSRPAAIGFLKTLHPKRANDTTRGPFLGKGLPTGLRLADGIGPKGLFSSRLKAKGSMPHPFRTQLSHISAAGPIRIPLSLA